jgi:hypothetical protein
MFQMPVTIRTPNAGQAIRLNRRGRGARYLRAESAQHRDQSRERDLAADPDRGGEHVQEQPDRVPADRQHFLIPERAPPVRGARGTA